MQPEKEPCPTVRGLNSKIFGKLRVPGGARPYVPDPVQPDPFFLDESTIGHTQRLGQELVECFGSDELPVAVTAAVGDPLGKNAELHRRELAVRAGIADRYVAEIRAG